MLVILYLLPFHLLAQAVISRKTLDLVSVLKGVPHTKLVLITGARLGVLLQRLPFLPIADAYVCENGGRIFYHCQKEEQSLPWAEDLAWRQQLDLTGVTVAASSCMCCALHAFIIAVTKCSQYPNTTH